MAIVIKNGRIFIGSGVDDVVYEESPEVTEGRVERMPNPKSLPIGDRLVHYGEVFCDNIRDKVLNNGVSNRLVSYADALCETLYEKLVK